MKYHSFPLDVVRRGVGAALLWGALSALGGFAQEKPAEGTVTLEEAQSLRDQAQAKRADLLSPASFTAGQDFLQKAQADYAAGKNSDRIQRNLQEASDALNQAMTNAELVIFTFTDIIKAYDDAQAQGVEDRALASYTKANEAFGKLIRDMEKGNLSEARGNAKQVETLLRQAELDAIEDEILGETREQLRAAADKGAANKAPVSYQEAQDALQEAETFIAEHRYEKAKAQELARQANYLAGHAVHLTDWIGELKKDNENWEKLIRQFERELTDVSQTLHLELEFDQDLDLPTQAIMTAIRSLQEDRQHLQEELADRDAQIGSLEAEVGKLKSETGKYVAELESRRADAEKRQQLEAKIAESAALFKPEEGTVLQVGDQIIIRLSGLRFASGASSIRSENIPLLTKTQQAIRAFPDRHIEIQGYTDAQGDDQENLDLSQQRAEAVRTYLLQNMNLMEDEISAAGKGKSQPLASNDTAAGRAANRRIEIVLIP